MFRPEVSLRNIVKCNVNRQGSEMEDHVQPKMGLVFYYNAWMISLSPKGGTRASECIECSEKFLFLYENFQIDSKRVRRNGYSQYKVISENILHSIWWQARGAALVRTITSYDILLTL